MRFIHPRLLIVAVLAAALLISGCALFSKAPTPSQQNDVRRQTADVVERLTLALNIATTAMDQLTTSTVSPELKIRIGCDVLKAIGQDNPTATVRANCGSIPARDAAPLHVAVKTAQEATSCASRQNTIAAALRATQPLWEELQRSSVLALQVLGGSLKFAMPAPVSCGGAL